MEKGGEGGRVMWDRARLTPQRMESRLAVSSVPVQHLAGGRKVVGQFACSHPGCTKVGVVVGVCGCALSDDSEQHVSAAHMRIALPYVQY